MQSKLRTLQGDLRLPTSYPKERSCREAVGVSRGVETRRDAASDVSVNEVSDIRCTLRPDLRPMHGPATPRYSTVRKFIT